MDRRQFLIGSMLAACAAGLPFPGGAARRGGRLLPAPLGRGDLVALVSPSGALEEPFDLQIAREVLEALGFRVRIGRHAAGRWGHLAGDDAARAGDLNAAFADPEVRAVVCARGGSGAARLLPLIDYDAIRRDPKVLLGYSDITALHCAIHAKTGLVTFHGPTGTSRWNSFNADQFRRVFLDRELVEYHNQPERGDDLVPRRNRTITITGGRARGELVGGNLTVLTALAGSPYLPDFRGKILFLEDVSEAPYRIDRMFSTLKLMGALDHLAGFIFGECTDCDPGNGYGSLTVRQVVEDYIRPLGIPAYTGAMIGHIPRQFIVPVGGLVEMDADAGGFWLLEPVFA